MPPPTGFVITPRDQQPQRSAHDDAEYRRNYTAAEYINALYALDNGWTGKGVKVGVLDDGIAPIDELDGQVDRDLSRDFGGVFTASELKPREGGANTGDATSTHGTPIAAIIAARNDGAGIQGLAPDVTLVSLRVDGFREDGTRVYGFRNPDAIRYAADIGLPILNMSLGRSGEYRRSDEMVEAVTYYNQTAKGLLVASAGNSSGEHPGDYMDLTDENAESWLFVVALNVNGTDYSIASYSNRCGAVMSRCVSAMGGSVTHDVNGNLLGAAGTSSAAPQVSALAAMILSKWPQLTGVDAGKVIINTARDIGEKGVDPIYGHGLIDVKAALSPVNPTLSNGKTTSSVSNSVMVVGGAFGGGYGPMTIENAMNDVTVLDAYGRDFTGSVSGLVVRPDGQRQGHWLRRRMDAQANAGTTGFITPTMSARLGYTAFETEHRDECGEAVLRNQLTNAAFALRLDEDTSVLVGYNTGDDVIRDVMGFAPTSDAIFAYSPLASTSIGIGRSLGDGRITATVYADRRGGTTTNGLTTSWSDDRSTLKLGLLDESGTVFGTPTGAGAMRFGDGATTAFVEASTGFNLGTWSLDGYASLGATGLKVGGDTLMTDANLLTSGRFGLTASRPALGGLLSFGVAQPLVVLSGDATFTVGDGYDLASRGLTFADRRVDLQGRIFPVLTVGYERIGDRSSLQLGASGDLAADDVRILGAWKVSF